MTPEQQEKCTWVNGYLDACLRNADLNVRRVRYLVSGVEERVEIEFDSYGRKSWTKAVNVTGDSPKGIMLDVLRII